MNSAADMSGSVKQVYGIVVMGMGIAGRARVRDLQKSWDNDVLKRVQLRGFVSRRDLEEDGVPRLTLEEALARQDVDIVVVATEPKMHQQSVRKILEAGKHCLVDYPVALSSAVAKELYQLAESKGVVLHEENIGLLAKTYKYLKEEIKKRPPVTEADMLLLGKYNGWIEDWDNSGAPFVSANGIVQVADALFGPLEVDGASLQQEMEQYSAVGHLFMPNKRQLNITLQRVKDAETRKHSYLVKFEDGSVIDSFPAHVTQRPGQGELGLFMTDVVLCVEEVLGKRDPRDDIQRTIRSLELAEEIHSHVGL